MADPTVPWGIPLFDDNTPFAPIQAPFNSQSEALNDALSDGAFMPYSSLTLLRAAPGTRFSQHATVYGDATASKNGDYLWNGSEWIFDKRPTHGTASFQTDTSGLGSISHGLGSVPSSVMLSPAYVSDTVSSLWVPTRGVLSSTTIQVVSYRSDSHARLLNTSVLVDWIAFP